MLPPSFDDLPMVKEIMYPVGDYNSINYFQKQAIKFHDDVYIRYQMLSKNGTIVVKTLTYGQVNRITSNLACDLHNHLGDKTVITLIEDHSVNYLILNLAIYKLRIPVLLLSTRNSSQAVCSLLKQTEAQAMIYGTSYHHIKDDVLVDYPDMECLQVPEMDLEEMAKLPLNPNIDHILDLNFNVKDLLRTVVIVHSSGTTSFPKAVHWSNKFLMYQMQSYHYTLLKRKQFEFMDEKNDVLISILPLFHASGQFATFYGTVYGGSVFFFHQFPPSVNEVTRVMRSENVTRFNAAPYYVNMILRHIQESDDIQIFQKLKLIMSGGAPTTKSADEFFLKHKINFAILYGMSECCNIMSSEASQSRIDSNTYFFLEEAERFAYMERFDGERYQLIIRAGSPFLATNVANRDNGEYATKDLFIKSKIAGNGYMYVGRTDDTLVMLNGEKTNPLPMEDVIKSNPMVSHCTVIGEAQHCSAALIELNFEVAKNYCLDVVLDKVHETVRKANKNAPNHSAILPEMVKIIPYAKHLPTSDKGTVSRKRAVALFQEEVDDMYTKFLSSPSLNKQMKTSHNDGSPLNIESKVWEIVSRVLNPKSPLQKDLSLFKQGLNSLLSIQFVNYISQEIYHVPQDFVYEHSTISSILGFFESAEEIPFATKEFNYRDTTDILYSYLDSGSKDLTTAQATDYFSPNDDKMHAVLLTGATGSLGSAILLSLLRSPNIKKVYALVRGGEETDLIGRVAESFESRKYPVSELYEGGRVEALQMNLEKEYLGFSSELYEKLKSEVTMVQACAWLLDFNQPVKYYDSESIKGLYNLVKFANRKANPIHLHFISSASASGAYGTNVTEVPMPVDPRVALPIGYAQSKFIVEQLFHYLVDQKKMPCYIYRVGQLCGDSSTGCWNTTEIYPLTFVGGGKYLKKMPSLDKSIDWLPVDVAGDAIVNIMLETANTSLSNAKDAIFHIVNPNEITWFSVLESMKLCGMEFDIVDQESWVQELALHPDNPAYRLILAYKKFFKNSNKISSSVKWETANTRILAPDIMQALTVKDRFSSYLNHWKEIGFYSTE